MHNKVKISPLLLSHAVTLMENLDIDDYPPETIQLFGYIFFTFKNILTSLDHFDDTFDESSCFIQCVLDV